MLTRGDPGNDLSLIGYQCPRLCNVELCNVKLDHYELINEKNDIKMELE